jgi:acetolactate synthase-1/2/3 large subunit
MAMGYAKATGRPGVYAVVPGPGVLNTTAALCTAWGCNTPVLCLTGQVPSAFLNKGRGHLHELPDQLATLRTLLKWAQRVERAEDAPALVNEAFAAMLSGRPGPVALEMCWDTMAAPATVTPLSPQPAPAPPEPDGDAIDAAIALLRDAKAPMIMVGGGAQHASAEVTALAERLGAPVTAFRSGRGVVSEAHPLGLSSAAAYELWPETDLLIGIGTRLELPYMRWAGMMQCIEAPQAPPHLVRIDIDPQEFDRLRPHVGVLADAAAGARALLDGAERAGLRPAADDGRIERARAAARGKIEAVQPQIGYLDVIREVLPVDGFFVEELCQVGFASYYGFPVYEPRTYVTPGFQGTLGFGYPTALGVKAAHPGRVALVFNNGAFGNVRRDQRTNFQGRILGADLQNPDFLKLAEAYGVEACRVASPEALRPALETAIARDVPALIEVEIAPDSEASPWPFIHPQPPA